MEKRIATIIGARPQFVKAAVVSRAIARYNLHQPTSTLRETLVHTGQHFDVNMSDVFFDEMQIPSPAYHLGIGGGSQGAMTGRMLEALEEVLIQATPDLVLVYGDTNSTLAGALAAAKLHVPVAHVEAGLRSFNRRMPEEINRVLTDHIADLLFAPTTAAVTNLSREGVESTKIRQVGDVMYDAALFFGKQAEARSKILAALGLTSQEYVLATCHRAENTDDPLRLRAVFGGLRLVAAEIPVVLPIHPRTRKALESLGWDAVSNSSFRLVEPLGYLDMVMLEKHARLIVTDSGGVQKEAFFHHVPCITLRNETEWVELVELGWNDLVPPEDASQVAAEIRRGLARAPSENASPYGDGKTAERIVAILLEFLAG